MDYRKNNGVDFNYFKKFTVTNTTYGVVADGYKYDDVITFGTSGCTFINEDTGSNVVECSLNGFKTHFELVPGATSPSRSLTFYNRTVNTIWFRVKSGSSGPVTVSVIAW